ncbi:MAG: hypothetical protein RLZZ141_2311 [Pseudomonadota bacterium]
MTITPQDAEHALKDIAHVTDRSSILQGYRAAGPMLILWGLVWFIVNVCCDRWPHLAGRLWMAGDLVGIVGSIYIGTRITGAQRMQWRYLATLFVAIGSAVAAAVLLKVQSTELVTAFFTLVVGSIYMAWGVWRGARIFGLGAVIVMVSMLVGLTQPPHFYLWMAVNGGGALILAGLWLRRA